MFGFELHKDLLQRGDLGTQVPPALGRPIVRLGLEGRLNVQGGRHLAWIDARLVGRDRSVRRDRARGGWGARSAADKGPASLPALEHALVLQALVDGANGVDVDAQCLREIPQARKALAGSQAAVPDASAQRPGELDSDWNLGPAIDREVQVSQILCLRTAAHALTLAAPKVENNVLVNWYTSAMVLWRSSVARRTRRRERALLPAKNMLEEVGDMMILTARTIRSASLPPYPYGGEFVSQFLFALRLCWLPLLISTICISYAAPGLQAANFLTLFGALDRLGGIFTLAVIREIGPFVTAIVLAGVAGTAITADLGARKIREELDALQVLGVDPIKNLVVPRFLALMLVTGLFNIYAILFGIFGGILAELVNGYPLGPFWSTLFANADTTDLWGSALKATLYGAIIAIVCCYKGMTASGGAEGVGRAVNQAVVTSVLAIFSFDYVFTGILLATHPQILVPK